MPWGTVRRRKGALWEQIQKEILESWGGVGNLGKSTRRWAKIKKKRGKRMMRNRIDAIESMRSIGRCALCQFFFLSLHSSFSHFISFHPLFFLFPPTSASFLLLPSFSSLRFSRSSLAFQSFFILFSLSLSSSDQNESGRVKICKKIESFAKISTLFVKFLQMVMRSKRMFKIFLPVSPSSFLSFFCWWTREWWIEVGFFFSIELPRVLLLAKDERCIVDDEGK